MHQSELLNTNQFLVDTVEPRLTATSSIRPPHCYGHFIPVRAKAQSVIFIFQETLNTATLLIWPNFCGPLVTRLTGFHCDR